MSFQAIQSVRDNSKVTDQSGRLILMVIASYCNPDGTMNGLKNPPSIETIAAGAGCHKNTVLNWLPKLEELNELAIERTGKGRGAKNFYAIKLPIMVQGAKIMVQQDNAEVDNTMNNGTSIDVPLSGDNGTRELKVMVQGLTVMVQNLTVLVQEMVQIMVQNGTPIAVPFDNIYKNKDNIYSNNNTVNKEYIINNGKKPSATKTPNGDDHKKLMNLYQEALGYKIPNGGQEAKAAKNILKQYSVEETIECYRHLKGTEYWSDKHLSLMSVHRQIGAWKQSKNKTNGTSNSLAYNVRMLEGV